ncbi:MAG: hypothetical protein K0S75_325 [Clostridia bacterium]|jgi:hypothetical protein|nr:hypothetical protein [Clostridia bacterium]
MKKKLIIVICFILLFSLINTGCSASIKNENHILSKEVISLKENNAIMEKKIADLEDTINSFNIDSENLKSRLNQINGSSLRYKDNIYPIYTADNYTYETMIAAYIYMPKETALKKKLETLAKVLSETHFDNLPIQVLRIEEQNKKKIAIVNLMESAENQKVTDFEKLVGKTWMTLYMQGSCGGTVTQTTLIETMLQREYKGPWIDGVKFLYDNGVCDYEHAPSLKDVNYRN